MVFGEGEERLNLEVLLKQKGLTDDVELAGFHENPYAFMKNSGIYVLSSKFEGLGNAVVEALALECSIVSTDCPTGPREILDYGNFGKMVPVGDVDAMANALLSVLEKPPKVNSKLLNKHLSQFQISNVVEKYMELFKGL